jgi:hypothetical protein
VEERDPFDILGVSPEAEIEVIRAAYRALARKYHPDSNLGTHPTTLNRYMAEINWAMQELDVRLEMWRAAKRRPQTRTVRDKYSSSQAQENGQEPRSSEASPNTPKAEKGTIRPPKRLSPLVVILPVIMVAAFMAMKEFRGSDETGATFEVNQSMFADISGVPEDIRTMVMRDIERRNKVQGSIFGFGELKSTYLTGGSYPDLIVPWNEGGSCGYFTEVWGYRNGAFRNLAPGREGIVNGFGCGGTEVANYLGLERPQLATVSRTYGVNQFNGGEFQQRTVWCWTGTEFIPVVAYFEDQKDKGLRTETRNGSSRCR